jgi:hypothetical protein
MEMPDLPPEQKREEERRALKFWVEHCHILEDRLSKAKIESTELKKILKIWMPEVMSARSEDYFAAGWLTELDVKLPEMDEDIRKAATILGEIPTYWDGNSDPEKHATWRTYSPTIESTVKGNNAKQ